MKKPFYENGFWYWWNPARNDWFAGCSPTVGKPAWAL